MVPFVSMLTDTLQGALAAAQYRPWAVWLLVVLAFSYLVRRPARRVRW